MKEHCKHGHLLSETRRRTPSGHTYCSVCHRERAKISNVLEKNRTALKQYRQSVKGKEKAKIRGKKNHQRVRQTWLELFEKTHRDFCKRCGYGTCFAALDFHHVDPTQKKVEICVLLQRKITEDRLTEIYKTITLCKNCHAELHAGLWKVNELIKESN